jgi:tetratricopeptide (TPR) repeat protein
MSTYAGLTAIWSRDPGEISRFISSEHVAFTWSSVRFPDAWLTALAARAQGDDVGARTAFGAARPQMEEYVTRNPTHGVSLSFLAIADAGLGRTEQALEEAKRACEMSPFDRNNLAAVIARCNLAVVYAWTGHNDLALAELRPLVERPSGGNDAVALPSYGDFRQNPLWDPLRKDPGFEAIVQRLAPATSK